MPTSPDPQKNEHRGTYPPRDSEKELIRLTTQDRIFTAGMGGVLPEQPDPIVFRRVLDVGCGPGGWIMKAAQTYPTMSLIGIDISRRMIEYARAQAEAHQIKDRVEFHVMDALLMLEFPAAFFDLVNLRFGISFLRTWDWPKVLTEMVRITRPSGIVRVTESQARPESNSPALTQLFDMVMCALFRAGHYFTPGNEGLSDHLVRLLNQYGCQQIQTKVYILEYRAGTLEGQAYYEDMLYAFQTARPFIQKWGCAAKDYEAIYQQALSEMQRPDFHATWNLLTAWGSKSRPKSQQPGH